MQSTREKPRNRRTYAKPRLRTIQLRAEEVLGSGCKTTQNEGPSDAGVSPCYPIDACYTAGS